MSWAAVFFSFNGRITRRTWWTAWIVLLVLEVAVNHWLSRALNDDKAFIDGTWENLKDIFADTSGWIVALIFLWPNIAMNTKRFHDLNMPGWWWLLFVAPFLAATAISISPYGTVVGPDGITHPSPLAGWAQLISGVTAIATLAMLGFVRGTAGPNRFGPPALSS
jgi:uncharacterized membrane protein YhaH (DUF805 family)